MTLAIHHHAPVYVSKEGLYVQSFIGAWVAELASQFDTVVLLFHTTESKTEKQDYLVKGDNIELVSLGENHGLKNRGERIAFIKSVCSELPEYDILLIRGVTPRQRLIANSVGAKVRAFWLVGSLVQGKPKFSLRPSKLFLYLMFQYRKYEVGRISKNFKIIANSPILVEEVKEMYGVPATFISTNTIQQSNFRRVEKNFSGSLKILFVGRVEAAKGIYELFDAFGRLVGSREEDLRLEVVGPCNEDLKNNLLQSLEEGARDRVSFAGFVPFGPELFKYYEEANYYLLPSYHEGFPHSLWESACTMTPVITTPVGGIPGLVNEDYVTFTSVKDPKDLAEKVNFLIENPAEREKKVAAFYEYAQRFTVEQSAVDFSNWVKKEYSNN